MKHYEASARIAASPEAVWSVLTDVAAYPSWDSGVTKVDGTVAPGAKITIHTEVSPRAFPVKVTTLDAPGGTMVWTGGMPLGLFTGVRTFRVRPDGDETVLEMREEFSGPLLGLIWRTMPDLQPSFDRFVAGAKAVAEAA